MIDHSANGRSIIIDLCKGMNARDIGPLVEIFPEQGSLHCSLSESVNVQSSPVQSIGHHITPPRTMPHFTRRFPLSDAGCVGKQSLTSRKSRGSSAPNFQGLRAAAQLAVTTGSSRRPQARWRSGLPPIGPDLLFFSSGLPIFFLLSNPSDSHSEIFSGSWTRIARSPFTAGRNRSSARGTSKASLLYHEIHPTAPVTLHMLFVDSMQLMGAVDGWCPLSHHFSGKKKLIFMNYEVGHNCKELNPRPCRARLIG